MPLSITRNRIRLPVDPTQPHDGPFHQSAGQVLSPQFPRARAIRVEISVFNNGTFVTDISAIYSSVTFEIKLASARTDAPQISKTVNSGDFVIVQESEWNSGDKAHVEIELAVGDTGLAMSGANELELWLVITATSTDGVVTLVSGPAKMIEDGGQASGNTPTAGDPEYLTADQTLAAIAASQSREKSPDGNYTWKVIVSNDKDVDLTWVQT